MTWLLYSKNGRVNDTKDIVDPSKKKSYFVDYLVFIFKNSRVNDTKDIVDPPSAQA